MTASTDEEPLRRHFVALATARYDDPHWGELEVADEIEVLATWLTDVGRLTDRAFARRYPHLAENPAEDAIRKVFRNGEAQWNFRDAAVVFVTGHGETVDGDHWTALRKSDSADLPGTALRTADLIRWMLRKDGAQDLLLIIDSCFSGEIAKSVMRFDVPIPERWLIIPSAERDGVAETGALTRAIAATVDRLRGGEGEKYGTLSPYFKVSDFVDALRESLVEINAAQSFTPIYSGLYKAGHVCLPNPHYITSTSVTTEPHRSDLALPLAEMKSHWIPRLRGTDEDLGGLYFSGRTRLMAELIRRTSTTGLVLITGAAGSGKSTALARLVTLSDPVFRGEHAEYVDSVASDQLPSNEAVDIAVLATGKHQAEILDQLVGALSDQGSAPTPYKERISWCRQEILARRKRGRGTVIVLDALDEALDPLAVIQLLGYLLEVDGLSLLVGLRSTVTVNDGGANDSPDYTLLGRIHDSLRCQGIDAEEVRVDADHWWSEDDVVEYVGRLLAGLPGSPYRASTGAELATIARAVAQRVHRSFLLARLAASWLASAGERVEVGEPSWQTVLDEGVAGVFAADLRQAFPSDDGRDLMVEVLRAISFAEGRGLPWGEVWPAMANALADANSRFGDRDIADLLASRMSGYLVRDVDGGTTVYRLFHDAVRSALRADQDEAAVQRRIANRLARFAGDGGLKWADVPPYVREHLAEHAAAGGVLKGLAQDVGFVATGDPTRLSTALATLETTKTRTPAVAEVYLRIGADRIGETFDERAANIEMALSVGAQGDVRVQHGFAQLLPWRLDMSRSAVARSSQRVGLSGVRVAAFAAEGDEAGLIVMADYLYRLQVWSGIHGELLRSWDAHLDEITAVELTTVPGMGRVIVSAGKDQAVRVWSLETGGAILRFDLSAAATSLAIQDTTEGPLAVAGCADGSIRVINLISAESVVHVQAHTDAVTSVETYVADGLVIISGSLDRSVALTAPSSGPSPVRRFVGPKGSVLDIALNDRDVPTIVVAAYADESTWLWPLDGREPRQLVGHTAGVNSVDAATVDGRRILATAGSDMTVRLWDAAQGTPIALLEGHRGEVESCRFVLSERQDVLLSSGGDRGIRAWRISDVLRRADRSARLPVLLRESTESSVAPVRGLAVFSAIDESAVAVGEMGGMIRLLDDDGHTERLWAGHEGPVLALSIINFEDSALLASAGNDGLVRLWDPRSGYLLYEWKSEASVWGLSTGELCGHPVLIAGGRDTVVRMLDVQSGDVLNVFTGSSERIWGVACTDWDGRFVVAGGSTDRSVWLWDGETGEQLRRFTGHRRGTRFVEFAEIEGRKIILATSAEHRVLMWGLDDGDRSELLGHTASNWGVSAEHVFGLPLLATAGQDRSARLWDISTGRSVGVPLETPAFAVRLHGEHLYIGSNDGLIRLALQPSLVDSLRPHT